MMKYKRQFLPSIVDSWRWIITLLVLTTVTHVYLSQEQYIYWSDSSLYYSKTIELADTLKQSPLAGLTLFGGSFLREYNNLYCLPLLPFIFIFGESRFTYILSNVLVYMFPFSLMMGRLFCTILSSSSRQLYWFIVFLTLMLPQTWIGILRGYPDMGGVIFIGLALLFYHKDSQLNQRKSIIIIAFFLSLSILFRRHFAYSVRGFILAIFLQHFFIFWQERSQYSPQVAWGNLRRIFQRIILVILCLILFSPLFVYKILTTNYRFLYQSFEHGIVDNLHYYLSAYGYFTWGMVIIGFILFFFKFFSLKSSLFFVSLYGAISIIQWIFLSRQTAIHYTSHFILFVILGLGLFALDTLRITSPLKRNFLGSVFCFLLILNTLAGLTFWGKFDSPLRFLLATNSPPLYDPDYHSFAELVSYLRTINPNQDKIPYSLGIRFLTPNKAGIYVPYLDNFSHSLLSESEGVFYGNSDKILNFLRVPAIDSRDSYPLEKLLQSQYILIPTFLHNSPESTPQIAQFVINLFQKNQPFAQDFQPLSQEFVFSDRSLKVKIYKRLHPTSLQTLLITLKEMEKFIIPRPSQQSDWLLVSRVYQGEVQKNANETINTSTYQNSPISLLYFGETPSLSMLTGTIQVSPKSCYPLSLTLQTLNSQGQILKTINSILKKPENTPFAPLAFLFERFNYYPQITHILIPHLAFKNASPQNFSIPLPSLKHNYLLVEITSQPSSSCSLYLSNIKLQKIQPSSINFNNKKVAKLR